MILRGRFDYFASFCREADVYPVTHDNVYEDDHRAEAYAKLEFPGTYYLAYRDIPDIISKYVKGKIALDFGCGTGRSTRFLKQLGFECIGVDISENMLKLARAVDSEGDYRLVKEGDMDRFDKSSFDLIMSAFTFDNIPTAEIKIANFRAIGRLLKPEGIVINLVSSPEIYVNEWASFTTRDFPENKNAGSGDVVKIVMKDVEDKRPVEDIVWSDKSYREVYDAAGLEIVEALWPLANDSEPFEWINETRITPWVIYVLRRNPID